MNFTKYGRIMDLENDNIWKKKKWINNDPIRKIISENIHWGQLKLFYSELEFLTISMERKYDLSDCVVIYIGAAPGTHIGYLTKLFPSTYWILIDPNKFHITKSDYIDIYTGDRGFFTDDMIPEILDHKFLKICKCRLFISDIRTKTEETSIFNEMLDQQRWLLKLNADLSMLKFRLPYTLEDGNDMWVYCLDSIKSYIKQPIGRPCLNKKNNMCYLKGDIYVQIFPPQYSTETRLIVDKKDKYKMYNYDTIKYEEKCYYYNTTIRKSNMIFDNSEEIKNHILGYDNNYEFCSIYYIIYLYCKLINKPTTLKNICNIIYYIHNFHNNITTTINNTKIYKSLSICKLLTVYEKFSTYDKYIYKVSRLTPEECEKLIESIDNIYHTSIENNNSQIKLFSVGNVLTKEQYQNQIYQLKQAIEFNNIIYNYLVKLREKK